MPYYEFFIRISDAFRDALIQRLTETGCLGMIENDDSLTVYFPSSLDIDTIKNDLTLLQTLLEKAGHSHELTYEYALIPEKDWNETWKKSFQPVDAGQRFTILPPWEKEKKDRINLVIDPGMAFGTGHHETTRSCLVLMEHYAPKTDKENFLDLGTGTGILAIAARKLGYRHVIGIDTDILAIDAARENIVINNVPDVEIREDLLEELDEHFDVIAANLISGVLVLLAPALFSRMNPGGIAILSGILVGQNGEVIEAMEQAGLLLRETYRDGKWVSLVMERDRKS
ncbi:MAG: 50S ribosomal protein L11 methyltransferase [Nitrospirae bacterium]|nr:50S ribosomal protein L11 methyltransferase [Nitrospirota bacterium]